MFEFCHASPVAVSLVEDSIAADDEVKARRYFDTIALS
jgi:hypothetical protein